MNEHQRRLFRRICEEIDSFDASTRRLDRLVGELHGAFEAAEIRDEKIRTEFYSLWGDLETISASAGANYETSAASSHLQALRSFVEARLRET